LWRRVTQLLVAAQLQGQQLLTTVFLIKALGGDWQGSSKRAAREP
jgi:hypothetical protein